MSQDYCCKPFKQMAEDFYIERERKSWFFMDREGVPMSMGEPLRFCPWCGEEK